MIFSALYNGTFYQRPLKSHWLYTLYWISLHTPVGNHTRVGISHFGIPSDRINTFILCFCVHFKNIAAVNASWHLFQQFVYTQGATISHSFKILPVVYCCFSRIREPNRYNREQPIIVIPTLKILGLAVFQPFNIWFQQVEF